MKIYTSVPRDFTRVKEKVIFNLTKRQIVCFGGAALIGVPSYFFIKNFEFFAKKLYNLLGICAKEVFKWI